MIYEVTVIISIEADDPDDAHDKVDNFMENDIGHVLTGYTIDAVDGNEEGDLE